MVAVALQLPTILYDATGGLAEVTVEADTLETALRALCQRFPKAQPMLFDDRGDLHGHVLVYLNLCSQPWATEKSKPLQAGDEITLILAVAGGI